MAAYFVDPVNGSDSSYDGLSPTVDGGGVGPFKTLQVAANNALAGSDIYCMNTGPDVPASAILFNTNASSITSRVRVFGADATGAPLLGTGSFTIDASGSSSAGIEFATITQYTEFHDIDIVDGTSFGVRFTDGTPYVLFNRCNIRTCASDGVKSYTVNGVQTFRDCNIHSNAGYGFNINVNTNGNYRVYGCRVYDNGAAGIRGAGDFTGFVVIHDSLIYRNTAAGILIGNNAYASIVGNTLYGNTGAGLSISPGAHTWVLENSIAKNGANGIYWGATQLVVYGNHYHDNTLDEWGGVGAGVSTEYGRLTGDPMFARVTAGSEMLEPARGSPLGRSITGRNQDAGAMQYAGHPERLL